MYKRIVFCLLLMGINKFHAQTDAKGLVFNTTNGLGVVTKDSTFSLNYRFRTQARAAYNTVSQDDFSASEIEGRIRRLRMRFEGFLINKKINYYIQLSFSRGDMDWVDNDNSVVNSSPNIVRDAVIIYKPNNNLSLTFGQTKLPGNRQRVVSSGELQFADRSIVNAAFNIDRDFGAQFAYRNNISTIFYVVKGAVTTGEGRNSNSSNAGLAYTGRLEILPFGEFKNKGDYFEGDLEREEKPKISIAGGYHHNKSAARTSGTTGKDLYENRHIDSFIADFLLKYNGFALSAEYINRNTANPITVNTANQESRIYVGEGKSVQLSYLFKNNIEIAGRYAIVSPFSKINNLELERKEMGVGVTKYLRKHRVKLQSHLFYNTNKNLSTDLYKNKNWTAMFQIEFGI
jgi:hypothetical protein